MPLTDEEAALQAISTLDPLSAAQKQAQIEINNLISPLNVDPHVDVHELFRLYNILYFRNLLLPRVEVSWSSRLTLCAGICELVKDDHGKYRRIRLKLSEPLLKFRPREDTVNTLLHESIHAYFFVTSAWRHSRGDDGTGHGAGFLLLADAISNHGYGVGDHHRSYYITVYHSFHDEVDSYKTHIWQCDGPCRLQGPYFGLVKRSMNRAPGKSDSWWKRHEDECGGAWTKVAEPEVSREQLRRLSGMQRAGRQRNKIDGWVRTALRPEVTGEVGASMRGAMNDGKKVTEMSSSCEKTRSRLTGDDCCRAEEEGEDVSPKAKKRRVASCPICDMAMFVELINEHIDVNHPP